MSTTKIILVDDHALYRLGVRVVIAERMPEVEIIAEYSSGTELLGNLELGVIPDLILLDIIMPEVSGIDTARIIREKFPEISVIMLSSEVNLQTINELLEIGVNGYLSKLAIQDDLVNAVKAVMSGSQFFGRNVAKIMYDTYIAKTYEQENKLSTKENVETKHSLTSREIEIIELLCDGITAKEIATKLGVSSRTIDNHRYNILQKLGFHNTIELVKFAIKEGIVVL